VGSSARPTTRSRSRSGSTSPCGRSRALHRSKKAYTACLLVTWNLAAGKIISLRSDHELRRSLGATVVLEKWPVLGRHERAAEWLRVWTDLGRAPRTIDAYARGLAEYLVMCDREGVDPIAASRAHVAVYVRELTQRLSHRGANVVSIDSGVGLANATIQQRLVPVRLFYDFLMEEGLRGSNPVGRGRYTPCRRRGGHQRGLVPRLTKLPWIPAEQHWRDILAVVAEEPVRNRVMLALAYDAALRPRGAVFVAHRRSRPRAPDAAGSGGDHEEPVGAGGAVLGADRGAVVGLLGPQGCDQPGSGPAVLVRVPSQPR
jgi:hypothetical protein